MSPLLYFDPNNDDRNDHNSNRIISAKSCQHNFDMQLQTLLWWCYTTVLKFLATLKCTNSSLLLERCKLSPAKGAHIEAFHKHTRNPPFSLERSSTLISTEDSFHSLIADEPISAESSVPEEARNWGCDSNNMTLNETSAGLWNNNRTELTSFKNSIVIGHHRALSSHLYLRQSVTRVTPGWPAG